MNRFVSVFLSAFVVTASATAGPPQLIHPAARIIHAVEGSRSATWREYAADAPVQMPVRLVGHEIPTVPLVDRLITGSPDPGSAAATPQSGDSVDHSAGDIAAESSSSDLDRLDLNNPFERLSPPPAISPLPPAPEPESELLLAMSRRGNVQFRNAPLGEVVFVLSDQWRINIVASNDVEGDVSGTFRGTPLWEVLDSLLLSTGYGYQRVGESLVILPKDEVDPSAGFTRGRPNFAGYRDAANSAGLNDRATVVSTDNSFDSPLNHSLNSPSGGPPAVRSTDTVAATTIGGGVEVAFFSPQYTEAETLSAPLIEAFEGSAVRVAVYPEENRIMVIGSADQIAIVTNMIEQLDRPRPQVRITALIYDVALSEIRNIGLNVNRDALGIAGLANEGIAAQAETLSDFFTASSDLVNGGSSIGLRTIQSASSTSLLLEALHSNSESKLLADPSITVGDRHDASIRIVERIPIITANPLENSNAVFTQTQFEEAGIILNVLPRISRDGTIEMVVKPEFSTVTEILPTGPRIDSRTAETTVRVADGQMFVLGGLRQKRVIENVRGIPFLKDLKFIGPLFKGHSTDVSESELIVFLKPEIVHGCQPVRPREHQAYRVGGEVLGRIPYAEDLPLTPCCCDPGCPNHRPRPRINAGDAGLVESW